MKEKLPEEAYNSLKKTIEKGESLDIRIANVVAHAMKEWALEKGATHYCHWFQPMTGTTAEKHDAFLSFIKDGITIERFSGEQLIQSEPDASSFPSGGMRTTFEARGYTAWDPTSPAFLIEGPHSYTLCIPTIFLTYNGEALDEKTPLLRSSEALNKAAVKMLNLLGRENIYKVITHVGAEQEYFLVDKNYLDQRLDLLITGRSLVGAQPPKGQQLEDHYFGSIPSRVLDFMQEVEHELYLLGIPAKTRHNEVAPHQYEIAPIHEEVNIAADHNLLIMETMRNVALRKNLALLLHEKPFAGINGSGKHNNWSMVDSEGKNLLEPGDNPSSNLQFLIFLVATVKAVYQYGDLLRAAISNAGNDHRLGANEAPPAIISVFLGDQLTRVMDTIEQGIAFDEFEKQFLNVGLSRLPVISKDNTDRNRTSPFAFTGNKFEFRAVPSSMPISFPNAVLNTAVAASLDEMADFLSQRVKESIKLNDAIMIMLKKEITEAKMIRFEGDNYSQDWVNEAEKRGLPNLSHTPMALKSLISKKNMNLMNQYKILSKTEVEARYSIRLEQYIKQIEIESKTLLRMVKTQILPSAISYQGEIAYSLNQVSALQSSDDTLVQSCTKQMDYLSSLSINIKLLILTSDELESKINHIHTQENEERSAFYCAEELMPHMLKVRDICDLLENTLSLDKWPFPTYLDLLFRL